jgi:hypothetical protein
MASDRIGSDRIGRTQAGVDGGWMHLPRGRIARAGLCARFTGRAIKAANVGQARYLISLPGASIPACLGGDHGNTNRIEDDDMRAGGIRSVGAPGTFGLWWRKFVFGFKQQHVEFQ